MPLKGMVFLCLKFYGVINMPRIYCPMCGCDEIEIAAPHISNPSLGQTLLKPTMQSLMQYIVNYAAMGISGARLIKGQRPVVYVVGAVIGGAVGCAACFLNYVQEQQPNPMLKETAQAQILYECLECGHHFADRS